MNLNPVIIKFGGSIITDKSQISTINPNFNVVPILEELRMMIKSNKRLILIHGAGSFGHPQAAQHGLMSVTKYWDNLADLDYLNLLKDGESIMKNYCKLGDSTSHHRYSETDSNRFQLGGKLTKEAVMHLHEHFKSELVENHLPIVSIHPSDYLTSYSKIIDDNSTTIQLKGIQQLLKQIELIIENGKIPLIHGDVIGDNLNEFKIISGDLIAYLISCNFNQKGCKSIESIYLTDVNGVYDKDPKKYEDAQLIPLISINGPTNSANSLVFNESNDSIKDITGSMKGKLKWAIQTVQDCASNCQVYVINITQFNYQLNCKKTIIQSN